jgi:hypothetical protein
MHGIQPHPCAMRWPQVLEGYMLQGSSGAGLADRVLQCFKDSMSDATLRVVRSLLLMQARCGGWGWGECVWGGGLRSICPYLGGRCGMGGLFLLCPGL